MSRWQNVEPDWDDDLEYNAEDDDDDEPTISCPYCRREIHEDSARCPYCERYISREDSAARKPWWLIVGVGACLYVVYRWIIPW